jgi:hypothetical protein
MKIDQGYREMSQYQKIGNDTKVVTVFPHHRYQVSRISRIQDCNPDKSYLAHFQSNLNTYNMQIVAIYTGNERRGITAQPDFGVINPINRLNLLLNRFE